MILPETYRQEPLTLRCFYDDVEVFINGKRVMRREYHYGAMLVQPDENPLKPGRNVLAVQCTNLNIEGPGYAGLEIYHGGNIPKVDFTDKNRYYYVAGNRDELRCVGYDIPLTPFMSQEGTRENRGKGQYVPSFTSDGKRMCRADEDNVVRLWSMASCEIIQNFGPDSGVDGAVTPDGSKVLSVWNNRVYVWNPQTGKETDSWQLPGMTGACLKNMAISPDGKYVAVTYTKKGKTITGIWEIATQKQLRELDVCEKIMFSPEGTKIIGLNGVFDIATGKRLYHEDGEQTACAWSPAGNVVAFGSRESAIATLRDADTGKLVAQFQVPGETSWSLSFSTDGKYLAAATRNVMSVWDTQKWEMVESRPFPTNYGRIAFLPHPGYAEQIQKILRGKFQPTPVPEFIAPKPTWNPTLGKR